MGPVLVATALLKPSDACITLVVPKTRVSSEKT